MQILFKDIVAGNADAVRQRIENRPESVALAATAPPAKYAGLSPPQVAYLEGEFEIAAMLLEHGADPNFIEHEDREPWAMPVLHDAIKSAVMPSRWLRPTWREDEPWRLSHTADAADAAYAALEMLLDAGADVRKLDSYGNSALGRAALDARQILPTFMHTDPTWQDPKPLNPELVDDLSRIFTSLIVRGADPHATEGDLGKSLADFYANEPVARFLSTT